jgi:hypothetical protein
MENKEKAKFNVKTPEGLAQADKHLQTNPYISTGTSPDQQDRLFLEELEQAKIIPSNETHPYLFGYYWGMSGFHQVSRDAWGLEAPEPVKVEKKEAKNAEKPAQADQKEKKEPKAKKEDGGKKEKAQPKDDKKAEPASDEEYEFHDFAEKDPDNKEIDYDKLIKKFGTKPLTDATMELLEKATGVKPHIFIRRGT